MGQPEATTAAIFQLIENKQPPLRLLGKLAYPLVKQGYNSRFAEWDAWAQVNTAAHGD